MVRSKGHFRYVFGVFILFIIFTVFTKKKNHDLNVFTFVYNFAVLKQFNFAPMLFDTS